MSGHAEVCLLWEPPSISSSNHFHPDDASQAGHADQHAMYGGSGQPSTSNATLHDSFSGGGVRAGQRCQGICRKSAIPCPNPGLLNPLRSSGLRGRLINIRVPLLLSPRLYQLEPGECPPTDAPPPYLIATVKRQPRRDAAASESQSSRRLLLRGAPRLGNPAKTLNEHVCVG
jgi:hypothetical protein